MEEGYDVEHVTEMLRSFSAVMKLAREIGEFVSRESNALLSLSASRLRRLVTRRGEVRWIRRHRGACLGGDVVCYGIISLMMSSRDKLWRTMLSCLSLETTRRLVTWRGRYISFPRTRLVRLAKESDCCGSHVKRASTMRDGKVETQ